MLAVATGSDPLNWTSGALQSKRSQGQNSQSQPDQSHRAATGLEQNTTPVPLDEGVTSSHSRGAAAVIKLCRNDCGYLNYGTDISINIISIMHCSFCELILLSLE